MKLDLPESHYIFTKMCGTCGKEVLLPTVASAFIRNDKRGVYSLDICDDCRRKLCTCSTCSAFDGEGCCQRLLGELGQVGPTDWCRDGYRQAKPITVKEAEKELNKCD